MQLSSTELLGLVDDLGSHFRDNLANRFTRKAVYSLNLGPGQWDLIDALVERIDAYRLAGYRIEELYQQVLAAARLVKALREDLMPRIRNYVLMAAPPNESHSDKVFREMAINNFGANLKIFADRLNLLYLKAVELDKADAAGKREPAYTRMPELKEIGKLLVGG
jgi:hypothetical protein